MSLQPLEGYTSIKNAPGHGKIASFMGVVTTVKDVRKSKGTDWVLEFALQDDYTLGLLGGCSSIKFRMFKAETYKLPKVTKPGDVAILRNVRLNAWGNRMDCLNTSELNSGVLVIPAEGIPVPGLSTGYQEFGRQRLRYHLSWGMRDLTPDEQMAVIRLKDFASEFISQIQKQAASLTVKVPTAPEKLSLIKDLDFNRFYDIRAHVINSYYTSHGTVELKVTDYTPNTSLFYYADPVREADMIITQGWKGPYGYLVLSVILWESNAAWARANISEGDYIFLRNMRTKLSPSNKLEGALHQDKRNPDQVDVRKLTNISDIQAINKRREDYESKQQNKSAFHSLQNESNDSSAKASMSKKERKRQRQREQKLAEQKELEAKAKEWEADRSGVNANIRAAFPEMKLSTLSEIIHNSNLKVRTPKYNQYELPFVNTRHRARVRVVDFFPPELVLFAHSTNDPQWNKRPKKQDASGGNTKERWEWGFVLLLEDANVQSNTVSEKLRVVVGNDVGQGLLKQDAFDLNLSPKVLK